MKYEERIMDKYEEANQNVLELTWDEYRLLKKDYQDESREPVDGEKQRKLDRETFQSSTLLESSVFQPNRDGLFESTHLIKPEDY